MDELTHALTLWRPWCWTITHGSKRVENRPRRPPRALIGKLLALHAGLHWDYGGAAKIVTVHPEMPRSAGEHPCGIVGVARVARWVDRAADVPPDQRHWFFGPFGWLLEEVVAIPRVPIRGAQGVWPMPDDVGARVRALHAEARRAL